MKISEAFKTLALSFLIILFGDYWYLFIGYLILNILDWITGSLRAIKLHELSSTLGIGGIIKKVGYWVVLGISFFISYSFTKLGSQILHVNLSFMFILGWFTLISLITNEAVSILENLTLLNIKVPSILIKSLKLSKKIIDNTENQILKSTIEIDKKNKD